MGNAPSRPQVDLLSCRQICPHVVSTAHALLVSWHKPHCSRTVLPQPPGQRRAPQPANTGATDPSRRAPRPVGGF
jgi:hypothetical protein